MKTLVVIYQTLKALLIVSDKSFKTLAVKLFRIEMKLGGGYILVTQPNAISPSKDGKVSRFIVNNRQMASIIAAATMTEVERITPSIVRHFIKSINMNTDVSNITLSLTYHDTVKNHELVVDTDSAKLLPNTVVGDKVELSEGYQDRKTAEMIAFESDTRINVYSVIPSKEAEAQFESARAAIDVAIDRDINASLLAKGNTRNAQVSQPASFSFGTAPVDNTSVDTLI